MWVLVPQLSERGAIYSLPDPAQRSRRPVPSRPEAAGAASPGAARPSRRCVGTPVPRCLWGCRGCLGFPSLLEKLSQRVRRRFWPVSPVAFSLCVVFSFVSLESRPRLLFQPESSPLYLGNLPARGKNADLGGSVFLFFLSFFLKKKREKRTIAF